MPNPRTPAPSRIGKTLGAILSNSRRGTTDLDAAEDMTETDLTETAESPKRPRDYAPQPEPATPPDTVAFTPDVAARDARAGGATLNSDPTRVGPSPAAPIVAPVATASADPDDDASAAVPDDGRPTRRKKRETFLVPEDLADAMRNAIVHLSGPPLYYTLAEFGEHAIRSYIAQLEREHNAGRPFPARPRAVRQGRPLR